MRLERKGRITIEMMFEAEKCRSESLNSDWLRRHRTVRNRNNGIIPYWCW